MSREDRQIAWRINEISFPIHCVAKTRGSLPSEDKPNYELIKLWMAFDEDDEKKVFDSNLVVNDPKLADNMLFENTK